MRAERINKNSENCYILTETQTQNIFLQIEKLNPEILLLIQFKLLHSFYTLIQSPEVFPKLENALRANQICKRKWNSQFY